MKKCPFCAEEILDEAVKCNCGSWLDGRSEKAEAANVDPLDAEVQQLVNSGQKMVVG